MNCPLCPTPIHRNALLCDEHLALVPDENVREIQRAATGVRQTRNALMTAWAMGSLRTARERAVLAVQKIVEGKVSA